MNLLTLNRTIRRAQPLVVLLTGIIMIVWGCGAKEPPLSKEAQAFKKEILQKIDKLTKTLSEPVARQDWQATKPILQEAYQEMEQRGELPPGKMVILDRDGITQEMYPSREGVQFDFSSYKEVKETFNKQRKLPFKSYVKGEEVYGLIAPILQEGKVVGAIVTSFSAMDFEQRWRITPKEFLSIDFD